MKIPVIKKIIQSFDLETLRKLEEELINEQPLSGEIGGEDEAEKLTHILAAIWIKEQMQENRSDIKTEIRNYSKKIRESIS